MEVSSYTGISVNPITRKRRRSQITSAVSLLNSSVGISRSLDGDDAYVTDNIVTAVFSLCFWPLVAILIEIGYSAGRSGMKSPSLEGLCLFSN